MKLSEFDVQVPKEQIALYPVPERDSSRLLVANRKTMEIEHRTFRDIVEYFEEGDVLIMNDSKVFPAKMYGLKEKTGARIEVFLLRELNRDSHLWDVVVDPARKIRVGNKLFFGNNELTAEVVDNTTSRGRMIRFLFDGKDDQFYQTLDRLGEMPIPRYLDRPSEYADRQYYQSIFATYKGSVAAPDASFHFTKEILYRLELQGVEHCFVTLHTGLGSFRDVEVEDLSKHKMDSEQFEVKQKTVRLVNEAKTNKKKVCAVGATVMRALESAVTASKQLKAARGWTEKFIFPEYQFNIANTFLTNFQPPKSTMMMMKASFMDFDFMVKIYEEAAQHNYRFYCYGDSMLIL